MRIMLGMAVLGTLGLASSSEPGRRDDNADVRQTVERFFSAMRTRDTAALRSVLHAQAKLVALTPSADSVAVRISTADEFFGVIGSAPAVPLERMWNPEIRVDGPLATLWTRYDFHRGGEFSHCGTDSFQLARINGAWVVTALSYTVVRPASRCEPSPLGPPKQ
jgi:hypothetical protein